MLTRLEARSFRNLGPLVWEPGPGHHLLLGENGAGKTSLLEAIYVVATTHSFRTKKLAECCHHGDEFFRLDAEVESNARTSLDVSWANGERKRRVNSAAGTLAEHLAVLPLVTWTAADSELFLGSPSARRRFLDRGLVGIHPGALDLLSRYRRILSAKRSLLLSGEGDLEPWNSLLARVATELTRARAEYVEKLRERLASLLAHSGLPLPPVELRYRPSPANALDGQEAIHEALAIREASERRRGTPLIGPHRDELLATFGGHALGAVASAGERKAVGLLLCQAQGELLHTSGRSAVYLLDDADIELSRQTLDRLWQPLATVGQLFASSNRPGAWADLPLTRTWFLDAGSLRG